MSLTNKEAIAYYFVRALWYWDRGEAMEADLALYQAVGFAGQRWPWSYSLPVFPNKK